MKTKILGAVFGLAVLAASTAASAHVNLAIGVAAPVAVYAPAAPMAVSYGGYGGDDWREREWRRHEWREHEWRRERWREHEWRERHRYDGY